MDTRTLIRGAFAGLAALLIGVAACSADEPDTATPTTLAPAGAETPPAEAPEVTNARRSAESYLDLTGFSRTGLIGQLEFEGYSTEAATAAVDSLGADWAAQAVRSAEAYLGLSGFSHSGLVDQLQFEGYTPAEAEHGASVAISG